MEQIVIKVYAVETTSTIENQPQSFGYSNSLQTPKISKGYIWEGRLPTERSDVISHSNFRNSLEELALNLTQNIKKSPPPIISCDIKGKESESIGLKKVIRPLTESEQLTFYKSMQTF